MTAKINIEINIDKQTLTLFQDDNFMQSWPVSTAKKGAGEEEGSECTPRGRHFIAEKIGKDAEPNTIFVGRENTGDTFSPSLRDKHPDRDWILTRILWLKGEEEGINLGDDCDTYKRYIYIHGCPDDTEMGVPGSRGCIRMRNEDIISLFDKVEEGTPVLITEE